MVRDNNVVQLDSREALRGPGVHPQATKLVDECEIILDKHLHSYLKYLLDNVDDTLFEMADKAETNAIQTMYFDAMREIRLKREQVERLFRQEVQDAYRAFWRGPRKPRASLSLEDDSLDSLELVGDSDLEESLAIGNMANKGKEVYRQELFALEQRLNHVVPDSVDEKNHPLGPPPMADAIRKAAEAIDADVKIKLILYKLFDKYVMNNLGPMYAELNQLFIDAGILPKLRMKARRSTSAAPQRPGHAGGYGPAAPAGEEAGDGSAEPEALDTLQQLLAGYRQATGGGAPAVGGAPAGGGGGGAQASTQDVLTALSQLQSSDSAAVPAAGTASDTSNTIAQIKPGLMAAVQSVTGNGQLASVNQVDEDAIDVVCMLFDFILEDRNLPVAVKALVGRLQIPILKVAILDKEFFGKKTHPARRLLNELAQAGMGMDPEAVPEQDSLYLKIEHIVNRILEEFQDDASLFAELLDELQSYLREADEPQEEQVRETTEEAYRQREEYELARRWVTEVIDARLTDRRLPKVVFAIAKSPWQEVLLHTYIDDGLESEMWKTRLRVLDQLLWSVEPKRTQQEHQELARAIPEILTTLRTGLKAIEYDAVKTSALFEELQRCHLTSLRGGQIEMMDEDDNAQATEDQAARDEAVRETIESLEQQMDSLNRMEAVLDETGARTADEEPMSGREIVEEIVLCETGAASSEESELLTDDEYIQVAQQLEIGDWVEFTLDNKNKLRGKLLWKSEVLNEYTFVDWKYKVVAEKSLRGLATDLRRGTAVALETAPLVDRAVDAVVHMLKRSAPAPA